MTSFPFQSSSDLRVEDGLPGDLRQLSVGQRLLVWTFRAFAIGRWGCPLTSRSYATVCGVAGPIAFNAVRVFAQQVLAHGRRPVILGRPGMLSLTRDEQLILAVFAAAQDRDLQRCQAHLTWLLARTPPAGLGAAATVAGRALAAGGRDLIHDQPWCDALPGREGPTSRKIRA